MPQFDQFSFFNQVFWFFFFFFSFYFIITYFLLPNICYNIKFRKKKIYVNLNENNKINFEKNKLFFFFNDLYKKMYFNFEHFLDLKKKNYIRFCTLQKNKKIINNNLKKKLNFFLNMKLISKNKLLIKF